MATISEVANITGARRESLLRWIREFAEHLSLTANPPKGRQRQFSEADIRVLAFVGEQVEAGAENDEIRLRLNSGDHLDERFLTLGRLHTSIFQEVPEEIDETWRHGVLIGGMATRNWEQVARAYKRAADVLLDQTLRNGESHEIDYPILFLYRHTAELYLKSAISNPPGHHDLSGLIQRLEAECGQHVASWVKDRLWDFHRMDQMSDLFRYADPAPDGELWIDFHQLKVVMDRLVEAFEEYLTKKGKVEPRGRC